MRTPFQITIWFSESAYIEWLPCVAPLTNIKNSPMSPEHMDWSSMYPAFVAEGQEDAEAKESITQQKGQVVKAVVRPKRLTRDVEVADIGCGFGGLLMALAPSMPETLCLGELSAVTKRLRACAVC